jgi:hypothetical protein
MMFAPVAIGPWARTDAAAGGAPDYYVFARPQAAPPAIGTLQWKLHHFGRWAEGPATRPVALSMKGSLLIRWMLAENKLAGIGGKPSELTLPRLTFDDGRDNFDAI